MKRLQNHEKRDLLRITDKFSPLKQISMKNQKEKVYNEPE